MSKIGERERVVQNRVIALFRDQLKYQYLGNWEEREDNRNIEIDELKRFLVEKQRYDEKVADRAISQFKKIAGASGKHLYDINREVYELLRYGVKIKIEAGDTTQTVFLIDWKEPRRNHFAIAEEVTILGQDKKASDKRPDIVIYVNGIALGVLELKRSIVSVAEGIRQNIDNQQKRFIEHFFSTVQLIMAGSDTEGLRYGVIQTREKYYLSWKEASDVENELDRSLLQLCEKNRFLELVHDFIVFDAGTKKLCRPNQYFGVKAAREYIKRREGGIIWHTQGSGKSLTMVWLTKWIRENVERDGKKDARVLIITDRTELDQQIESVYKGVKEEIYRTKSGADLIATLNSTKHWLICSLIHKFGGKNNSEDDADVNGYIHELTKAIPPGFVAKGDLYVFVDECHRTQSTDKESLHSAMKRIIPDAVFIGFTGTPLLKKNKKKSIEVFGGYIHTYKYHEAVKDGVVLDLRYEARDIDQRITSQTKIDQWFDAKTRGLMDLAKLELKRRWGTLQKVLSSKSRLGQIVNDILLDMELRDRLKSDRGNAMLISGSIYEACKFYELFTKTPLHGKCAIVTSYRPSIADTKLEDSGEGSTEKLEQYELYQQMLADWFREAPETAVNKAEEFEKQVKKKFIDEPGQMKLLIVVDKLLTGFDAPPATYLYIDKSMQDHGLFQAICRVNRLDGDDKEYGYIVDYKDLFKSLDQAVKDYTCGAFDAYDKEDVEGLITDRLTRGRERLEELLHSISALCEPVAPPKDQAAFQRYFSSKDHGDAAELKESEPKRLLLYKLSSSLVRAYVAIADEMQQAGYTEAEAASIKTEVTFYENLRATIKIHSGDAIDLKQYEPAMRHLIDTYIQAEESQRVSRFDDLSLIQIIVERGVETAIDSMPQGIRKNKDAAAEAIENNVRKLIIDESPINPKYYEKMSELLDTLILERRSAALDYQLYLRKIEALAKKIKNPSSGVDYPAMMSTSGRRALYDNLNKNEAVALAVDDAVQAARQDDWRGNAVKVRRIRNAIRAVFAMDPPNVKNVQNDYVKEPTAHDESMDELVERILTLVKNQRDY